MITVAFWQSDGNISYAEPAVWDRGYKSGYIWFAATTTLRNKNNLARVFESLPGHQVLDVYVRQNPHNID